MRERLSLIVICRRPPKTPAGLSLYRRVHVENIADYMGLAPLVR